MSLFLRSRDCLIAVCFVVVTPPLACAALVLDAFDDLAVTASPEMEEIFITTPNVGVLSAERRMRVIGSAAEPVASLDSDSVNASALTANLEALNPHPGRQGLFAFQFGYSFAPSDVSQGGASDAIIFDFQSLAGNGFVPELGVLIWDNTDLSESYFAAVRNLPLSSGPVSISIPFSSFTQRGGAPGLPDFSTVERIDFDFFFQFPPSDVQWSAQIEGIRFGRVPEPNSLVLLSLCAGVALRWRK